jgi:hypothetical protein
MQCRDVIFLFLLIFLLHKLFLKKKEKFTDQEIKNKSKILYKNKDLFTPGVKYTKIKDKMQWIDPVMYDDVYHLALNEKLSISNLEKTLYNSIK